MLELHELVPRKGARRKECQRLEVLLLDRLMRLTRRKWFAAVETLAAHQGSFHLLSLGLNAGPAWVGHQPSGKSTHEEHFSGRHFPVNEDIYLLSWSSKDETCWALLRLHCPLIVLNQNRS